MLNGLWTSFSPLFGVSGRVASQLYGAETIDPATSPIEVTEVPATTSLGPEAQ